MVTRDVARGVAAAPRAEVIVADALRLPYRDGVCDAAICIAVLHHISSEARRQALLQEILRILRRQGSHLKNPAGRHRAEMGADWIDLFHI